MKKILLTVFLAASAVAVAQNGVLTNAILYQRDGDLVKALTEINKAAQHEKTKDLAKTWYYKGAILRDIYISESSPAKEMVQDALLESTTALQMSVKMDAKNGEYKKMGSDLLSQNWVDIINRGVLNHQSKKYPDALELYKVAQQIKPTDTTAYLYAVDAADEIRDNAEVRRNLDSLLKIQPSNRKGLTRMVMHAEKNRDFDLSLKYSQKALGYYADDRAFEQSQFSAWMELKQFDKAQEWLNVKLKAKPFDGDYLLWQALIYSEQGNKDQELLYYQKLIALEPHHLAANFNAALIYLEKGKALAEKNDPNYKAMFTKSMEHAKRARSLADEEERKRIDQLITNLESLK